METVYFPNALLEKAQIIIEDENEFRHAIRSLRKQIGDELKVTNGQGQLFNATITQIGKSNFTLQLENQATGNIDYLEKKVYIALALLNQSSKMKLAIEKLTEIGISGLIPLISKRTVFPEKNLKGLESSAISALKQCGGATLPQIFPIQTVQDLLKNPQFDHKFIAHFTDQKVETEQINGNIVIAIGPEGGWSKEEVELFLSAGYQPISLNRRVLRAETAALVAAAKFLN